MTDSDVLIVGAGVAGLSAASALRSQNRSSVVLEARERVGGRILTLQDERFPIPLDLGAEFIHGLPEETWKLVRRFHLAAYEMLEPAQSDDFWKRIENTIGEPSARAPDPSFLESLDRRRIPEEDRRLALSFIEGFHAADPAIISARALEEETAKINSIQGDRAYRLQGGYATLVQALLLSAKPDLHLNCPVDEIRWDRNGVEAFSAEKRFRAKSAILTLPPAVLSRIRFTPELPPSKREALSRIRSGAVVKVILGFREAFWERRLGPDLGFIHEQDGDFPTWWSSLPYRVNLLTGWTGGPRALALSRLPREEVYARAIQTLSRIFDISQTELRDLTEIFAWHDWVSDPYSQGAYTYLEKGGIEAPAMLAEPLAGTLHFAGEATERGAVSGTVAGAIESSLRVTDEITARYAA